MNYVLVSIGSTPQHLKYCIRQILAIDPNTPVYLITDQNVLIDGVNILRTEEFNLPDIGSYLRNNPDPLWYTSLLRIFYINAFSLIKKETLIHFDNDVLIYYPSCTLKPYLQKQNYITPHKTTEYTFGFSVINNAEKFNTLTEKIYELVLNGENYVKGLIGETHEMSLLGHCGKNLLTRLPVHPLLSRPFGDFIFDPSSYGQFIDGTPAGHLPGFIDETQYVGKAFKQYPPDIFYLYKKPHLNYGGGTYRIYNLHIHTKQLQKFLYE